MYIFGRPYEVDTENVLILHVGQLKSKEKEGSPHVTEQVHGEGKWRLRLCGMSPITHLFYVYCSWLSCSPHPCPGGRLEDAGLGMNWLGIQPESYLGGPDMRWGGTMRSKPFTFSQDPSGHCFSVSHGSLSFVHIDISQCLAMVSILTFHAHLGDGCHFPPGPLSSILNSHFQPDSSP